MAQKHFLINYQPILFLPCFSKNQEHIMYNNLYIYLAGNKMLVNEQFGFMTSHSTDHTRLELVQQICDSFY